MSLRILLVSVEAPPSFNAEAFQVGKVLQALQQQPDLVVDLVTAEAPRRTVGGDANPTATSTGQVVTVPCRLRRWQRALIRLGLPWLARRPDWWFLFAWRWRRVLSQLNHPPDLIYSRAFPPSSTLAAYHLARHYGVPWFLHLSDPWCESSLPADPFQSRWNRRWERICLQAAQRISFTSATTLQRYCERYPELSGRMVLDPNCYDEANLNPAPWAPGDRFRLVHTGSFTLGRRPDTLFRALASLPDQHPLLRDLELIHAGPVDAHTRQWFRRAGSWLRDEASVPMPVALELQRQADLLLAIDWQFDCARDAQYLLSKLTDYLAIRRPVLLVTNRDSASWQFVAANGLGTAIAHGDVAGLQAALIDYWQAWRQRQRHRFELPPPSAAYSATEVARGIADAARASVRRVDYPLK